MNNLKHINKFQVFLIILIGINLAFSKITFVKYELSATEVDFTLSTDDQTVTLKLTVDSPVPINFLENSFYRADGTNIFDGGNSVRSQAGTQTLSITLIINAWGGDGDYKVKQVRFSTEQEEMLKLDQEFIVTVKGTRKSTTPPKIISYNAKKTAQTPLYFPVTLQIESEAPADYICQSIYNPDNINLYEGCDQISDPKVTSNIETGFQLQECFKEGKYTFTYSVINKAQVEGEKITFYVDVTSPNCSNSQPQCNVMRIESNYKNNQISEIGQVKLTIIVQSTSDLYYTNTQLISPLGTTIISGGNQISSYQYEKTPIKNNPKFQYKLIAFQLDITIWSLRGVYKYQDLKIQNEQLVWTKPTSIEITVGYPQSPWVEVILDINDKIGQWKNELQKLVEEFLKKQDLKSSEICLQEKKQSRLRFLQDSKTSQVQLFIGKLESSQLQSMLDNKEFFQSLQQKFVVSVQVGSSDKTINIPPPNDLNQNNETVKSNKLSFILSLSILIITLLL